MIVNSTQITGFKAEAPEAVERVPVKMLGQNEFLKLLVTQMRNQDPMEPVSDTEFIAQMAQFIAHAAVSGIGVGVVERPVAVNEGVANRARRIARKETVFTKITDSLVEFFTQTFGCVVVVMEVNLDFASGGIAQFFQSVDDVAVVLFDGVEKGVAWANAVGVLEVTNQGWEFFDP